MIATLNGIVTEKSIDQAIIECAGVGYGILLCSNDHAKLKLNDAVRVYIYENIKEEAHDLYAFLEPKTKTLFILLLSVNGVGPKAAMAILNIANFEMVVQAIGSGDVKFITQAKGVGAKAAQKVVLDLKDKLSLFGSSSSTDFESVINSGSALSLNDEATEALISLGYNQSDAIKMLEKVDSRLPVEERIRLALKG